MTRMARGMTSPATMRPPPSRKGQLTHRSRTTPAITSQRLRPSAGSPVESSAGIRSHAARYATRPAPPTSTSTIAPILKMSGSRAK